MERKNHTRLLAVLYEAYERHAPRSAALNQRAGNCLIDGGNHALRLILPFPPRISTANGAYVHDEDEHEILDFWQGHFANILGHNPEIVTSVLSEAFSESYGLQTGFTDRQQVEAAEIVCRQTGGERIRFTTSGSLATMYAIMLARAFTGRHLVLKVGGGWHGSQPWGLKGVSFDAVHTSGPWRVESQGIPPALSDEVLITKFNDVGMLREQLRQYGDRLACFITEPVVGAGGFTPATREYLQTARELTHQYGIVLILDEVITGFRFRAGDVGALYGVKPDLATFGKIIGGGMPVAAVVGRADIVGLVGREQGSRVKFSGGTYSGHPAAMLAVKTLLSYLVEHEAEIYPRLADLGEKSRRVMEKAFADEGILARCTGYGDETLPGSSLGMCHFPYEEGRELVCPDDVSDPGICDIVLRDRVLQLALLLEDVHVVHGLGALSTRHTHADIDRLGEACSSAARFIKSYL